MHFSTILQSPGNRLLFLFKQENFLSIINLYERENHSLTSKVNFHETVAIEFAGCNTSTLCIRSTKQCMVSEATRAVQKRDGGISTSDAGPGESIKRFYRKTERTIER